jgi:hypothetical protein
LLDLSQPLRPMRWIVDIPSRTGDRPAAIRRFQATHDPRQIFDRRQIKAVSWPACGHAVCLAARRVIPGSVEERPHPAILPSRGSGPTRRHSCAFGRLRKAPRPAGSKRSATSKGPLPGAGRGSAKPEPPPSPGPQDHRVSAPTVPPPRSAVGAEPIPDRICPD